jgi:hypothetical protein
MTDNIDTMTNEQIIDSVSSEAPAVDQPVDGTSGLETQPAQDTPRLYEYQARGKTISEDLDTLKKRASMGYDYAQSMADLKKRDAELTDRLSKAEQIEQRWKPYNDYADQNPDWAERVNRAYEERFSSPQTEIQSQDFNQANLPPEIAQKLNQVDQFMQSYEQNQKMQAQAEEDTKLAADINAVKETYKDIDFGYTDPTTGKSLEFQVLEHASLNGINSFRAAFRDYYNDQLFASAQTSAKETAAKELQERNKSGFLGNVQASMKPTPSHKNMSYDQLMDAAKSEFNL